MVITEKQREKDLAKQLKEFKKEGKPIWIKDMDFSGSHKYLIKMFQFRVATNVKKSKILVPQLDGSVKAQDEVEGYGVIPVNLGLVLAVGGTIENPKYEVGDMVVLNYNESVGTDMNPEYINVVADSTNLDAKKLAHDIPKRIAKRNIYWANYAFFPPQEFGMPVFSATHYHLPDAKIECKYKG